ncbi:ArnT family glycosyltransferase [Seongchinamella sediminis]|uniref:ArnT family glycosyltransferase n=1 Tax=Seongchinamella sediminis TaxID=2283635 RepID=UPI0013C2BA92|nr:glycosyltransferase family 39 protein [Seongchinamella sediminis]
MNTSKKPARGLSVAALAIVACGALLRLAYNSETFFIDPVQGDAAYYYQYAINLVEHGTFSKERSDNPTPDNYWAPGYPAFLAANLQLAGSFNVEAYDWILHSQVAVAAGAIWLLFLLGRMFMPGYWPLLPATLLAFSPHHVSLGSYALTETLFGFTLLAAIYFLARALLLQKAADYLMCGVALATSYMVNPVCLVVAPAVALGLWLFRAQSNDESDHRLNLGKASLLLLPLVVTASLWSLRSAIVVPEGSSSSGDRLLANLTVGLYPHYHEKWKASVLDPEAGVVVPGAGVSDSYATFFAELGQRFSEAPVEMLTWYATGKPNQLWQWNLLTDQGDIYFNTVLYSLYHISTPALVSYSIMHTLHPWLLICSLLGALLVICDRSTLPSVTLPVITYAAVLAISAVYVLTQAEPRYSVPLRPELYLTAVFFIWQACEYLKTLRTRSLARHHATKTATTTPAAD